MGAFGKVKPVLNPAWMVLFNYKKQTVVVKFSGHDTHDNAGIFQKT